MRLLVPRGDGHAVARAIAELAGAPDRARAMGGRGRAKAIERWSWPRLVDRMDDAYAQAIAARRAA